jgi:hypothetical protein
MSVVQSQPTLVAPPPWFQVRTVRLELGPCRSARSVLDALGDVLARTGLVAHHLDVGLGLDGYSLVVDCDLDADADAIGILAVLDDDEPRPTGPPAPGMTYRRCSLAR